ncbi:hypothetical protein H4O14_16625 [Bacillus sp. PAMC26568]|nr:hypothetical protein H4O14_16625 [Bacillus sp. PAMC26568]
MKTILVSITTFIVISGALLLIGYVFNVPLLKVSSYKESSTGVEATGSIIPFVMGAFCSWILAKKVSFAAKTIKKNSI